MAFDDIAAMPGDGPIIAEGPGFFPDLLAPVLTDRRKAVWLIPSDDFKRASAARRGKPGNRHETSDPVRAAAHLIARDLIMGRVIRERCQALGLDVFLMHGDESVEESAERIERRFSTWLG